MAQTSTRNSQDIKTDIRSQLFWDTRIDAADIQVDVSPDGRATLSGTVPTYADRRLAEIDAYMVGGVTLVDNQLVVSFPGTWQVPLDAEIAANIRNSIAWDSDIDESRINVEVAGGVVTLAGTVETYWQKVRARDIAENVAGVIDVVNNLMVLPSAELADIAIADDIRGSLARNAYINPGEISVDVHEGVATLAGMVPDYYTFRTAEDIAYYTRGVVDVRNDLVIRGY